MSTDWSKIRDQWLKGTAVDKGKKEMPKMSCGRCTNFRQNAWSAAGDGWCSVMKDGEANKVVMDNTDASSCPEYKEMERIRTDTSQFMWDQHFRPQRQLDEK
ncbi:MAG: hypothetical protein SVW57_07925 [Thermodesulfobacteriota bacterium]|nr:hypothetical protein [Thermodesulfobacteriota bacterium]